MTFLSGKYTGSYVGSEALTPAFSTDLNESKILNLFSVPRYALLVVLCSALFSQFIFLYKLLKLKKIKAGNLKIYWIVLFLPYLILFATARF